MCIFSQKLLMKNPYKLVLLSAAALILTGCQTNSAFTLNTQFLGASNDAEYQACWLEQPVNNDRFGQIGIARNIDVGATHPIVKSRQKALTGLADYLGAHQQLSQTLSQIERSTKTLMLNGRSIYFAEEEILDGYVYSYAQLDEMPTSQRCPVNTCRIAHCQPSWLCHPAKQQQAATLGVSYRASSPSKQHREAIENGLFQAGLLYGVKVTANNQYRATVGDSFSYSVYIQDSTLDLNNNQPMSYAVTDLCHEGGMLYSRVQLFGELPSEGHASTDSEEWLLDPKFQGVDGAVGAAQKPVASGLMSDQIKLAIKRAAVQLALEQRSDISEQMTAVSYEGGASIIVRTTNESTQLELQARVLALAFKQQNTDQLEVYAWVAR